MYANENISRHYLDKYKYLENIIQNKIQLPFKYINFTNIVYYLMTNLINNLVIVIFVCKHTNTSSFGNTQFTTN